MEREPEQDWWDDVKGKLDAPEGLEEVEGVHVNQFTYGKDSCIVITVHHEDANQPHMEASQKQVEAFFKAFFAPARVATIMLRPSESLDFKVFNPVDFTAVDEAAAKTEQMLEDFKESFNRHDNTTPGPAPKSPIPAGTKAPPTHDLKKLGKADPHYTQQELEAILRKSTAEILGVEPRMEAIPKPKK